jgi:transposase
MDTNLNLVYAGAILYRQEASAMDWSQAQVRELAEAGRRHPKPGARVKALAVLAVARGNTYAHAAACFAVHYHSVSTWTKRYREQGLKAFDIAPGRGRRCRVDEAELVRYALQSPRNFGVPRSRWTLQLLADTVPSLRGFTQAGVLVALRRCGISYKRGQAWMLSPDPEYEKKDR